MEIVPLLSRPAAIPVVAGWYYEEWGYMHPDSCIRDIEVDLMSHTADKKLPQAYVAVLDKKLIGAVELKLREVSRFPEFEYWLGGVYVDKQHRGKGIATELAQFIMQTAHRDYGIKTLYLQTEKLDGGLYARLGWSEVTRIIRARRCRLIMVNQLT